MVKLKYYTNVWRVFKILYSKELMGNFEYTIQGPPFATKNFFWLEWIASFKIVFQKCYPVFPVCQKKKNGKAWHRPASRFPSKLLHKEWFRYYLEIPRLNAVNKTPYLSFFSLFFIKIFMNPFWLITMSSILSPTRIIFLF